MEEYYLEAGRAARDGLPSDAIVYYNNCHDISKLGNKHFHDHGLNFKVTGKVS